MSTNMSTNTEDRTLLDSVSAAAKLGVRVETLARWRGEGRGPEFIKSGRYVRYSRAALDAWIARGGDR